MEILFRDAFMTFPAGCLPMNRGMEPCRIDHPGGPGSRRIEDEERRHKHQKGHPPDAVLSIPPFSSVRIPHPFALSNPFNNSLLQSTEAVAKVF